MIGDKSEIRGEGDDDEGVRIEGIGQRVSMAQSCVMSS